ncbi:MAG TPA: hypothetical protein VNA25_09330 [Phycisphaerae bacterium]|nr:hypothetical protein [Phycisphaerae bacterium]
MKDFEPVCQLRLHCPRCRGLKWGRAWRKIMARQYEVPAGGIDWPCPKGAAWESDGPIRGLGDLVAKAIKFVSRGRIKPCGGCKKRRKRLNELVPFHSKRS